MVSRKQALAIAFDIEESTIHSNEKSGVIEEFAVDLTAFGVSVDITTLADGAVKHISGDEYTITFHEIKPEDGTVIVTVRK